SAVADIGLSGVLTTVQGRRVEGFRIVTGGGNGADPRLANPAAENVPADRVVQTIQSLLDRLPPPSP
ncbi:MAG: hypothetical protein ACYS5V_15470, partial [Planctomycetota bacterium]